MSLVSIIKDQDPGRAVREAIRLIGGMSQLVKAGDRVLIKPNLVVPAPPERGTTTNPNVVRAVCELAVKAGAKEVIVADSPFIYYKARDAFAKTGVEEAVRAVGARVAYLDEEEYTEVSVPDPMVLSRLRLPKIALDVDVTISVPKMKTHLMATVSLGIKNQHGLLLSQDKKIAHREDIHLKLLDILKVQKPSLVVVDGFPALEGQGPTYGDPVQMNLAVAGLDTVSVDAVCSSLMGFEPMEIPMIRAAHAEKLGNADLNTITIVGEKPESVTRKFKRPSFQLVKVFPNVEAYVGGACGPGCMAWIRTALDGLDRYKRLDKMGRVNIIVGRTDDIPAKLEGRTFVVGDCAEAMKSLGTYVPGCPCFDIIRVLFDATR